ncbi:MAG: hypothetical protein LUD29_01530 [Clostridia bacterium]|nr:hypothetical protein [Clostridia bacterium]
MSKALNNKKLERNGYYDLSAAYQSMQKNIEVAVYGSVCTVMLEDGGSHTLTPEFLV